MTPLFQSALVSPRVIRRAKGRLHITRAAKARFMTEPVFGADVMLGEMRGQLKEIIHTTNNTAQKVDGVVRDVAEMRGLPAMVTALTARVTALETERNRRDGASSIIATLEIKTDLVFASKAMVNIPTNPKYIIVT